MPKFTTGVCFKGRHGVIADDKKEHICDRYTREKSLYHPHSSKTTYNVPPSPNDFFIFSQFKF